jgi:prevent-host-death family protein
MQAISVRTAKAQFYRLIDAVAAGEEIVITRAGQPVAKLISFTPPPKRRLGLLAGRIRIPADFDAPLPADLLSDFEGR